MMKQWLIIGGGIQGVTLASYLRIKKQLPAEAIAIVDPHEKPLAMWKHCTNNTGMEYLRSPSIHHLHPDAFNLERFAKKKSWKKSTAFVPPYDRPTLALFNKHSDELVQDLSLLESWVTGKVSQLSKRSDGWEVKLSNGDCLSSRHVVVAIGLSEHPIWPNWAEKLKDKGASINHIFHKQSLTIEKDSNVFVVGGGISAVQTALKVSSQTNYPVHIMSRHPFRTKQFDSDPGWLGPKYMRLFMQETSTQKRRDMIASARHRGSLPGELHAAFRRSETAGNVQSVISDVASADFDGARIHLTLKNGQTWSGDKVVLATGFHATPPGLEWLKPTIREHHLRCHTCGYPIVEDDTLEWDEGLFVMGALAELSLGPVARNISGARRGAERILSTIIAT
ncbi:FAD/NAD(P)-binding protein [Bacillus sp. FJAT-45037]|uniref:FAD/NAD(P)-binding protein n=1 Tax=Bacillus sp. FJAT-45037 TaxID=2011007 RepID=UPI000C244380|nr:FAD/NAD(P)-binding protein [Bacillus sp. FJAT-45037]